MKILEIRENAIVIAFEPGDAYRLAQACAAADVLVGGSSPAPATFDLPDGAFARPGTYALSQLYGALAGTFLASALACESFFRFSGDREDRFGLGTLRHYATGQTPHEVEAETVADSQ